MLEQTFYLIKPDGLSRRCLIRKAIDNAGFKIISSVDTVLAEPELKIIYAFAENPEIFKAHLTYYDSETVEAGIIAANNVIERFLDYCGKFPNPLDCKNGTLRNRFGSAPIQINGGAYYLNAVHRPFTKLESELQVNYYFEQILPKIVGVKND